MLDPAPLWFPPFGKKRNPKFGDRIFPSGSGVLRVGGGK